MNREIMSWLGGGATVIAAGIWTVLVFLLHDGKNANTVTTPHVAQSGTGIASGGNTVINAPVNIGVDERRVGRQIIDAQRPLDDKLEKLLALTVRDKGVEIAPLRAILVKLGDAGVSDEDIARRLDAKADELVKLRQDIARLRQGPAELTSFVEPAQALIDKGDFDGARATLAAAREAARKTREAARKMDEQSSRYEADVLAQEARIDHLQLAYRSAAAKFAEAAGLVAAIDRDKQLAFVLTQAGELFSQGEEFGDNAALVESVTAYRDALSLAPRAERPSDWTIAQNNLGNALTNLGRRGSNIARLEEAVTALRDALRELTRERAPLQWAMAQNNLAITLTYLSQGESGTARLEEAVTAFREALKELTRKRMPLQWATAQFNLGIALQSLGQREKGTAPLEQAVAAFREALQELTRERVPLQWAAVQNSLGNTLVNLGDGENGTVRLEEAVTAFRDALKERTRERAPLDWSQTQYNLGTVLQNLGLRESSDARIEDAVVAFREALKERTRERVPLDWAVTAASQGVALVLLAVRHADPEGARAALAQIEAASATMRDSGYGSNAATIEAQLANARALVADLKAP
jgi:tetratricopeptide (TPR) repeat protein